MGDYQRQDDGEKTTSTSSSSGWKMKGIAIAPGRFFRRSNNSVNASHQRDGEGAAAQAQQQHDDASYVAMSGAEQHANDIELSNIVNSAPTTTTTTMNSNPNLTAPSELLSAGTQESLLNFMSTANVDKVVIDVIGTSDNNHNNNNPGILSVVTSDSTLGTASITSPSLGNITNTTTTPSNYKPTRINLLKGRFKRKSKRKSNTRSSSTANNKDTLEEKLDTYSGVFLPCLAQIVGVIFFLRLPTITGQAGTIGTTLIVLICVISTFVTSLSLSAIASNGTIQAGGPYYIISRTLGVEIGGALGILFYLGTTLGASMHVMGAVETLTHRKKYAYQNNSLGFLFRFLDSCPTQVWSLLLMFIIARIVSVGSKYVTSAANFFLATVGLSIVSILLGTIFFAFGLYDGSLSEDERAFNDNLYMNYSPDPKTGVTPTFWGLVAIFYPATTGILAGTNRSSKLATPNKSIPIGTIGAIGVTTVLYLFQVWLIGSVVNHETLIFNKLVLASVAFPSPLMAKVGMVTSCVGAALQCMAGAPQLLGAIAADGECCVGIGIMGGESVW